MALSTSYRQQRCWHTTTRAILGCASTLFVERVSQSYNEIPRNGMNKTDIFNQTLECVANTSEIGIEQILSHNRSSEVVDARYVFVYLLYRQGFYPSCIAARMGFTRSAICHILSDFDHRRANGGYLFESVLRSGLTSASNNMQTTIK